MINFILKTYISSLKFKLFDQLWLIYKHFIRYFFLICLYLFIMPNDRVFQNISDPNLNFPFLFHVLRIKNSFCNKDFLKALWHVQNSSDKMICLFNIKLHMGYLTLMYTLIDFLITTSPLHYVLVYRWIDWGIIITYVFLDTALCNNFLEIEMIKWFLKMLEKGEQLNRTNTKKYINIVLLLFIILIVHRKAPAMS